ncbi:hypothetical protein OVY01_12325 [Robbsia sp. Bb-Pol-6]|uniref:Lipoprotein n=1 Tax=Robbsia betulipollinis TaxID=2981849 RepID=A0ABT3ZP06_9BURK|nr:hypothetical protein [Robbsia betulipollinis]MCY0388007.1 hypothetical protein [Robbsia betulipollinis]
MKRRLLSTLIVCTALAGCATKFYGRESELTAYEKNSLSCPEIDIETAKIDDFQRRVGQESQFDGRSALSFATDFGIGNAMEKSAAIKSANNRRNQLDDLRVEKGCAKDAPPSVRTMPSTSPTSAD